MSTPVSSQLALFRRMFSFTVHKQCSLRLQMAKAEEVIRRMDDRVSELNGLYRYVPQ